MSAKRNKNWKSSNKSIKELRRRIFKRRKVRIFRRYCKGVYVKIGDFLRNLE